MIPKTHACTHDKPKKERKWKSGGSQVQKVRMVGEIWVGGGSCVGYEHGHGHTYM